MNCRLSVKSTLMPVDYEENPPKGYKRLVPGGEVRLRGSYVIRADEAIRDADGNVIVIYAAHY